MKKITVEVSEGQERYIKAFARTFGAMSPGDFLLVMAMAGIVYAESDEEGATGTFLAAKSAFLGARHIPTVDPDDVIRYGVTTRPASRFEKSSAGQKQAAVAGGVQ